jgi:predicted  nucleic acid-binding Zn-ribbon protein
MNTRIDDKASVGNLNAHIEAWERAQEKTDEDIREIRARHDRELTEINKRHDNNLRELRQEINGMSDRLDKRFDQIISMLSASWGGK